MVYSSKRKNWLPNMPNVSRSGWTCGLGLTPLKSYQKDEVIVEGTPTCLDFLDFTALKIVEIQEKVLYNFKTLYTYIACSFVCFTNTFIIYIYNL